MVLKLCRGIGFIFVFFCKRHIHRGDSWVIYESLWRPLTFGMSLVGLLVYVVIIDA